MTEPWCVLLASREAPQRHSSTPAHLTAQSTPTTQRSALTATLRRAATVTSLEHIAAVVAAPAEPWRESALQKIASRNLLVQPRHRGTAYEVLFALLMLESRITPSVTVLFMPVDHVVNDEELMTNSLHSMIEWIAEEQEAVYLLGAAPQGPHDQLGYIIPWHDSMMLPSGVYEFVEAPDVNRARELINAGALWNTFIFGGSVSSLINLFRPTFEVELADLRAALQSSTSELDLARAYKRLASVDFSEGVLARQIDSLNVLRLQRCGWWPLKSPALTPCATASASRPKSRSKAQE